MFAPEVFDTLGRAHVRTVERSIWISLAICSNSLSVLRTHVVSHSTKTGVIEPSDCIVGGWPKLSHVHTRKFNIRPSCETLKQVSKERIM